MVAIMFRCSYKSIPKRQGIKNPGPASNPQGFQLGEREDQAFQY
jgi:hypothetical protein